MACVWYSKQGMWAQSKLDCATVLGIRVEDGEVLPGNPAGAALRVVPFSESHTVRYLLLGVHADIRVNGNPFLGVRVLKDRDEICVPGALPFFFSEREPAQVLRELPEGLSVTCPSCGDLVFAPAAECPACGALYHESEDRPCWSSGSTCMTYGCDQPTQMERAFSWTPLDLEMGDAYGSAIAVEAE